MFVYLINFKTKVAQRISINVILAQLTDTKIHLDLSLSAINNLFLAYLTLVVS